ncbi:ATP-dependent Clp protease ATP-binding subunit [Anaerophilus nitritogenes]|uniref:ATP-dependent Clp protease ATP-binding subunit n=1 Tax=Anaerophilus nitritogenes TaxID=2498136 RepID=UPI00101BEBEC|nr:ATP-dependent Clp protease ATP-binding subunit [Anaerophilus nitritogenes]
MKLCSVCKKKIAIVFTSQIENGKTEIKGLCMECAKKMGIPVIDQLMKQAGMNKDDIKNLTEEMNYMFEDMDMENMDEENLADMLGGAFPFMKDSVEEDKETTIHVDEDSKEKKKEKKIKNKKKYLEMYGTNLTERAKNKEIDKVIGRQKEISRVVQILNRRNKNNPILIGEPGVGKTAIAEGLALRIVERQVPQKLFHAQIYLLDLTAVVAGTQFRGQFEGRMKSIIKEAKECGNIILVIDEVHNIMGAGEVHGGVMNAANILKPALAKGEIQVIGATTLDEYRKHIEKDAALERRFQPVLVEEPTIEDTIEILKGIKNYYEDYHQVKISEEVIKASVHLSERYITDRFLPDKAIDVIDEAGSRANLNNTGLLAIENIKEALQRIQQEKENAAINNDYEKAAKYKMEEFQLEQQLYELEKKHKQVEIQVEDIAYVVEAWTNIPVQKITEEEAQKLIHLEDRIHKRVIGQDKAIVSLARTIRRNRSGFKKKKKPASFIFVGPTGVGKTELVKTLAYELFGDEDSMIRVDMSEYMEKHTVSKLIGAPPGYVGYDQGGQLTEKVRRKPYSVILLDEIEKAHPDVFHMLLQILEDGRLTDSQGRTVFFENTVIIMTSNAGTNFKANSIGFSNNNDQALEDHVKDALKETFKPEFLNRIDEVIIFKYLQREELVKIVDIMLKEVVEEAKQKNIRLEVSQEVKDFILKKGYDEKYGARPLRRTIQRYIEDEIAEQYLQRNFEEGDCIEILLKEGKIVLQK